MASEYLQSATQLKMNCKRIANENSFLILCHHSHTGCHKNKETNLEDIQIRSPSPRPRDHSGRGDKKFVRDKEGR